MSEYTWQFPSGAPSPPASSVPAASEAAKHEAEALDRLPNQFRDDPNVVALIRALAPAFQSLENAYQQLLLERSIDTAIGAQLDVLGKLVGQKRNGAVDDVYRRYIIARVRANSSSGTVEELIRITKLVLFDLGARITVKQQRVATIEISVNNVALTDEAAIDALILFLRLAVSGGVRFLFTYSAAAPAATFRLDTGPGLDVGILADTRA